MVNRFNSIQSYAYQLCCTCWLVHLPPPPNSTNFYNNKLMLSSSNMTQSIYLNFDSNNPPYQAPDKYNSPAVLAASVSGIQCTYTLSQSSPTWATSNHRNWAIANTNVTSTFFSNCHFSNKTTNLTTTMTICGGADSCKVVCQ